VNSTIIKACRDTCRFTVTAVAFVAMVSLGAQIYAADTLNGKVVKVSDGDTITILADNTQHRIRLANIDAPEKGQPWGNKSRQALATMVAGNTVTVQVTDTDRYGRLVGEVFVGINNANVQQVAGGHAWVYTRYNQDPSLSRIEAEAKKAKRGLWGLPASEQMPPWEWRHHQRQGAP